MICTNTYYTQTKCRTIIIQILCTGSKRNSNTNKLENLVMARFCEKIVKDEHSNLKF